MHACATGVDGSADRGLLDDRPSGVHHGADHAADVALLRTTVLDGIFGPHELLPEDPQFHLEGHHETYWRLSHHGYVWHFKIG